MREFPVDRVRQVKDRDAGPNPVRSTLRKLGEFLSRCVLPVLEPNDDARWLEIDTWLNEVRQVGIYPSLALPYFLIRRPDLCGAITATLLEDLRSDIGDRCEAAARGLRHWANLFGSKHAPDVPPELIQTLVERVAFRKRPGILGCTSYLIDVIVEQPQMITANQRFLLVGSLMAWHDATTLSATDADGQFARAQRPELRVAIARMAGALSRLYRTEPTMPVSIGFWRDASANDPLPEVRRAYLLWSERD